MIVGGRDDKAEKMRRLVYARQIDGVIILANCAGPPTESRRQSIVRGGTGPRPRRSCD